MGKFVDIAGVKFNKLTAIKKVNSRSLRTFWLFRCDCGIEKEIDSAHVRYGKIQSCGCYLQSILSDNAKKYIAPLAGIVNTTHGMSKKKVYAIWKTMRDRCKNSNNKDWRHYGGAGVTVCERWGKFENFYADMGEPNGLTLDRINPNGNYEPSNCRWATWSEQNLNKRSKCARN